MRKKQDNAWEMTYKTLSASEVLGIYWPIPFCVKHRCSSTSRHNHISFIFLSAQGTMLAILSELWDYSSFMEKNGDPRTMYLPHVPSAYTMLAFVAVYVLFVTKWGPKIMKNRKPFDLKYTMIAYNILQIVGNAYVVYQLILYAFIKERYSFICQPTDFSDEPNSVWIAKLTTFYFLVKVLDLIDTIFMVLRKKANQLSFLHMYHHAGMVFATWIAAAMIPGGHYALIGIANCFVHTIMYFYYLLCAIKPDFKQYVWWKKHLTELQMIQISIIIWHCSIAVINPFCDHYKGATLFFLVQNIIVLYMFWQFYKKAYFRKTEEPLREISKQKNGFRQS